MAVAVGEAGTVLFWDGSNWSATSSAPSVNTLTDVFGIGPDDLWIVGTRSLQAW